MIVGIVGLGLIGGSFAKAYTKEGHTVFALDTDESILNYAKLQGAIQGELNDDNIVNCDLIFVTTYPKAAIDFMEQKGTVINSKTVVIDCCGTKRVVVEEGMKIAQQHGYVYIGGHPMAGKQFSGFKYADENLFRGASMVIVPPNYEDIVLLDRVKKLLEPAGFSLITVTTAEKHDAMIAYTSQLTHIVANAYIKSPTVRNHKGMTGGSYKDMTRVAWLAPDMWTELCMENKDYLLKEMDILLDNLNKYREALVNEDSKRLRDLFQEGRDIKHEVDK